MATALEANRRAGRPLDGVVRDEVGSRRDVGFHRVLFCVLRVVGLSAAGVGGVGPPGLQGVLAHLLVVRARLGALGPGLEDRGADDYGVLGGEDLGVLVLQGGVSLLPPVREGEDEELRS